MTGRKPSERTPLLQSSSSEGYENDSVITENDIQTAEVVGDGALEVPQFPGLGKQNSQSHNNLDGESDSVPKPADLANFGENGLLVGITKTKFRFIFGGILMGYFVSLLSYTTT
jgi:hypothetical protein